jgi:hypothetical protein
MWSGTKGISDSASGMEVVIGLLTLARTIGLPAMVGLAALEFWVWVFAIGTELEEIQRIF